MPKPNRDPLAAWIPRLLAVWRRARKRKGGPPESLTPDELREAADAVRALSLGLTRERALAGASYMDDPRLLAGYLLFYWPVSYAQARAILGELEARPRSALDLGAGPGPVTFACLDAGVREVVAADRSQPALELLRQLAVEAEEAVATRAWDALKPALPEGRHDLVIASHLFNELWSGDRDADTKRFALAERLSASLTDHGTLLLMEPALRDTSRGLLRLRDRLTAGGFPIHAPCLFRGPCPALDKETDWCHAERDWEPPRLVLEIARRAGLRKEALKMSYLLVGKKGMAPRPVPTGGRLFRIVSEPLDSKGRLRYIGCGPEGRLGLSLQEKHVTDANRVFGKLARGDVIAIDVAEARGDGLALDERTSVTIRAAVGRNLGL